MCVLAKSAEEAERASKGRKEEEKNETGGVTALMTLLHVYTCPL